MLFLLYVVLAFWLVCNLVVFIKWTPAEMYVELVKEQNKVGQVCGNLFYLPCWIVKFIIYFCYHWLCKFSKIIKKAFFAIARFFQQIYHSIMDIL